MTAPATQDWKGFNDEQTFSVEIGGRTFLCARPSATQLTARNILPPALVLSQIKGSGFSMNGDRHKVLLDEKAQDALLDVVLIEPRIFDGAFEETPEGSVHRRALGGVRDALVIAILSQMYGTEVVASATFRDEVGDGAVDRAAVAQVREAADGNPGAAGGRVRGGSRAHARRG